MPATSWSALQDYELQFDVALALILAPFAATPYDFTLFEQDSVDVLVAPRLEYGLTIVSPAGPDGNAQLRAEAGLAARPTAFDFSMRFLFVYDRTKLAPEQKTFRGALRELLSPPAPGAEGAFSAARLPYLNIAALEEKRSVRGVLGGKDQVKLLSVWESQWDGIFNIRASALPD